MARIILTTEAVEQSTYVIPVTFRDEDATAIAPDAVTWTLTDRHGVVINSRSDVAISSLAATINIVLTGADLDIQDDPDDGIRLVRIEAVYSSSGGSNLNLREEIEFSIRPLVAV